MQQIKEIYVDSRHKTSDSVSDSYHDDDAESKVESQL